MANFIHCRYFFFSATCAGGADNPFSATIFIASLTGICTMPLDLSIHSSVLILLAQIGLRIGLMAGNTLQPRLRRHHSIILAKSLARGRRRRFGRSRKIQGKAEDINANERGSDDGESQGKQIPIDGAGLDVAFFE
jgi:hypothetical protein